MNQRFINRTVLLLAAVLFTAGCKPSEDQASRSKVTGTQLGIGGEGMNVLLISVDTTRADHLACYGHPVVKTPNIDRFASEGTRFAWCIASSPLTLPSHSSMLTGSYPFLHGARDNSIFLLNDANVTLAEVFKQAGYATHAEVAAPVLDAQYGLHQGFDTYGDVAEILAERKKNLKPTEPVQLTLKSTSQPDIEIEKPEVRAERKADEITRVGIKLLAEKAAASDPFFIFLHYFDPHWPHEAPERIASQYIEGYFAEITYFDEQFGKLMVKLRELGLAEKTLVVLVSDHGEGRLQHGETTHSYLLYDTTLHVPLIMRCPGHVPAGQVIESQVRLIDIASTIVDFTRLGSTGQMQGTSLLPLLANPDLALDLPCYSDTVCAQLAYGYSSMRSLRQGGWKYILSPRPELYNVDEDRLELFDLAAVETERANRMREQLRNIIAESPEAPFTQNIRQSVDEVELRKMEALGYVSRNLSKNSDLFAGDELDHFEPVGLNPRDRIEVLDSMACGLGSFRLGLNEQAERIFKRFCELEPNHPTGPSYLGRIYASEERWDEAIEMFRKAIELDPESGPDHRLLGGVLNERKRYDEARESFQRAIECNPRDVVARHHLVSLLAAARQYGAALKELNEALEYDKDDPSLHLHKGSVLLVGGRPSDAESSFREAIRLDPSLTKAHAELAVALCDLGRVDEAIEHLTQVIQLQPNEALLFHSLAHAYLRKKDLVKAYQSFQRVAEILPDNPVAHYNLATNLLSRRQNDEAIHHFRKAIEFKAAFAGTPLLLGITLEAAGNLEEAQKAYETVSAGATELPLVFREAASVLQKNQRSDLAILLLRRGRLRVPQDSDLANDLAWRLATTPVSNLRNGEEAVRLARTAIDLAGGETFNTLDTLGVAYAEAGMFKEAATAANRALKLAEEANAGDSVANIKARILLFEQGQPYHEQP